MSDANPAIAEAYDSVVQKLYQHGYQTLQFLAFTRLMNLMLPASMI